MASSSDYCIVVSKTTQVAWHPVVQALFQKHDKLSPIAVVFEENVSESASTLRMHMPKFTVFIATPGECSRSFVRKIHHLTRTLDESHVFSDTIWGILSAANIEDAVSIAQESTPLDIKSVFAGTVEGSEINSFISGIAYDELVAGHVVRKAAGAPAVDGTYDGDETIPLARDLCSSSPDMIITSGHARERNWSLGFRFKSGNFRVRHASHGPQLYAETISMDEIDITSPNPKILSAAGNCLMGHVRDEGSLACAWMHCVGVRQMVGYTVPTWYGYGGWGVHKYFMRAQGNSFAEAFFANMQSLLLSLRAFPVEDPAALPLDESNETLEAFVDALYRSCYETDASHGGLPREQVGLAYDRDHVAFYGDPAWRAVVVPAAPSPYTVAFEVVAEPEGGVVWRCVVTVHVDGTWTSPTPDDKQCSPGRPPFALLPLRVRALTVIEGSAVATPLFVLFDVAGPCRAGDVLAAVIDARF